MIILLQILHYGTHATPENLQFPAQSNQIRLDRPVNTQPVSLSYEQRRYKHYGPSFDRTACPHQIFGTCRFLTLEYASTEDDAVRAVVSFQPFLHAQTLGDLFAEFKPESDFASAEFFLENLIVPGIELKCWKRSGRECDGVDWGLTE
ncbi:hypothetical protein SS50377_24352 [Spironucleus salmonicida]|uniref:Uncharacterized protein n=1 Tax=Spironucleus salmonicida TaxID=348837 RepID=V6LQW6_9EUKA|nr:hypothetical protein SS50377_24352 [Spironucleus salmonicida]|eukprot:EST46096.1 Hypothetical protein SS50377_14090 [Spironucleus salmonicida]